MDVPDEPKKFIRTPDNWESWLDKVIADAQERGVFDNLETAGKPLDLARSAFQDDRELGFHMLKNAGFAPPWVEIDKEIRADLAALEELKSRALELQSESSQPHPIPASRPEPKRGRLGFLLPKPVSAPAQPRRNSAAELADLRRDCANRIDQINRKIGQYNAMIPREIWWLERPLLNTADLLDPAPQTEHRRV